MLENECQRIKVSEAAKVLGISTQMLRELMKTGSIQIGIVKENEGKKKAEYIIFKPWLDSFLQAGFSQKKTG